jgi:hypothetical protein
MAIIKLYRNFKISREDFPPLNDAVDHAHGLKMHHEAVKLDVEDDPTGGAILLYV